MRKYGQHFLISPRVIEGIVSAVPAAAPCVLEIGPGRGALTEKLLARAFASFTAVEIDPEMARYLCAHFPTAAGHIVQADFLQLDLAQLPQGPTFVVSNLPYVDAADILDKLLGWNYFDGAVLMFQKEQAQRILARGGQEGYGPLSVLTQVRARPALRLKVGKACFNPPPKVESAVLTFDKIPWQVPAAQYAHFARFIQSAFLHRRKTLFNSLALCGYDKEKTGAALAQSGLTQTVRAQDVPLEKFLLLFAALH